MQCGKMSFCSDKISVSNFDLNPFFRKNCRLPFDWKNPFGYMSAVILQAIGMFYITHIGICQAAFVSGTCLMLITMTRLLKKDLSVVNIMVKNNSHQYELMNVLQKCIDFHSIVKQLSIEIKDVQSH